MIVFIWFIALTTTLPWAIFFDLVVIFGDAPDVQLCIEVWPASMNGALYFLIANLVFCYILPMILITLCYVLIWIKVWRRNIPTDTKDAQMERMQQKSKVKVVKMLVAVVILFVLSWLPLYVIFARIKLGGDIEVWEEEILQIATPIAQWWARPTRALIQFYTRFSIRSTAEVSWPSSAAEDAAVDYATMKPSP